MSLRNPDNPAYWSDGKLRSQGNVFDTAYQPDVRTNNAHERRTERDRAKRARNLGAGLVDIASRNRAGDQHGGAHSRAKK